MPIDAEFEAAANRDPEGEARPKENAMLVLQRGAETGRRWPLDRNRTLMIGRDEECDIHLPDRQVSRNHARIFWTGDHYRIEDLGSKNGTHVNGQDVTPNTSSPLQDGDELQIALRFKLAFVDASLQLGWAGLGGYLGLVLVASVGLYHGLEKPAQRWLNRHPPRWAERPRTQTAG